MTNSVARNTLPIIISGGGIGGLACALALAQRNFKVVVCEQAPEFGQVGAGLQVAPNALSVLDALGVGQEVKQQALLIERMRMMDGLSGEQIADIACGEAFIAKFGNPYAVAHRADVHGALLRACQRASERITLRTDSRVTSYSLTDQGVKANLETGESISAAALIGADGIRSRIREQMVGDGPPTPIGAVIYRALVPAEQMPAALQHPYPTLWAGPGAHLIYYPVRDWTQFNVGITVNKPIDDVIEGEASVDEAAAAFAGWTGVPLSVIALSQRYQRYVIRQREAIGNWSDGAVTLLGDSAHPMVQYIAQGAAMALEDAICLADRLDANDGNTTLAFREYQDIRIVRSARVQISSLMLDRLYHARDVERLVRNSMLQERSDDEYYSRLAWVFTAPPYVTQWDKTIRT